MRQQARMTFKSFICAYLVYFFIRNSTFNSQYPLLFLCSLVCIQVMYNIQLMAVALIYAHNLRKACCPIDGICTLLLSKLQPHWHWNESHHRHVLDTAVLFLLLPDYILLVYTWHHLRAKFDWIGMIRDYVPANTLKNEAQYTQKDSYRSTI